MQILPSIIAFLGENLREQVDIRCVGAEMKEHFLSQNLQNIISNFTGPEFSRDIFNIEPKVTNILVINRLKQSDQDKKNVKTLYKYVTKHTLFT